MSDLFSDDNKVKNNFWSPKSIGDSASGFLVKKEIWDNRLKPGTKQTIYFLAAEDGTITCVAGRQGNPAVISGLENCKLGQKVGVKYTAEKPHSKPGFNAIKVITAYAADEFRPDLVQAASNAKMEPQGDAEGSGEAF